MNKKFVVSIFCTSLFLFNTAQAQNSPVGVDTSQLTETDVAGFTSGRSGTRVLLGGDNMLYGIFGGERRDKPCQLRLRARSYQLNGLNEQDRFFTTNPCRTGESTDKSVYLNRDQNPGIQHAIAGIQVCTNGRSSEKLKGIRISSVRRITGGNPGELTRQERDRLIRSSFQRTNCSNDWNSHRATCVANSVAVGARIFSDGDGISGIALVCAPATLQYASQQSVQDYRLSGPTELTGISGFIGNPENLFVNNGATFGITAVGYAERGDKPCAAQIQYSHIRDGFIDGAAAAPTMRRQDNRCNRTRDIYSASRVLLRPNDRAALAGSQFRTYVSGLRVCMNGSNSRIKGIQTNRGRVIGVTEPNSQGVATLFSHAVQPATDPAWTQEL
ncbi:MAG: hypothetical protein AAF404_13190 [Pseudomonadota bacterium]